MTSIRRAAPVYLMSLNRGVANPGDFPYVIERTNRQGARMMLSQEGWLAPADWNPHTRR